MVQREGKFYYIYDEMGFKTQGPFTTRASAEKRDPSKIPSHYKPLYIDGAFKGYEILGHKRIDYADGTIELE